MHKKEIMVTIKVKTILGMMVINIANWQHHASDQDSGRESEGGNNHTVPYKIEQYYLNVSMKI